MVDCFYLYLLLFFKFEYCILKCYNNEYSLNIRIEKSSSGLLSDYESVYLKNNRLGRATFFPLDVIKPRFVDNETIMKIRSMIDRSSSLEYNRPYWSLIISPIISTPKIHSFHT